MHNKSKEQTRIAWSYLHKIRQERERYSITLWFALRMSTGNNYNGKISNDRLN